MFAEIVKATLFRFRKRDREATLIMVIRKICFDANDGFSRCGSDRSTQRTPQGFSLRQSYLLVEDQGRMLHAHNEELGRFTWARKEFHLPRGSDRRGELSLFLYEYPGNQELLHITVNDRTYFIQPTAEEQGVWTWRTVQVEAGTFRPGISRIELRCDNLAYNGWALGIDSGNSLGRSWKTFDQGQTWMRERLGFDYAVTGEYLIRCHVHEAPPMGYVTSPALDVAAVRGPARNNVPAAMRQSPATSATPLVVSGSAQGGTSSDDEAQSSFVSLEGRSGSDPDLSQSEWTTWQPFPLVLPGDHRFVQWRAVLRCGDEVSSAPQQELTSVILQFIVGTEEAEQADSYLSLADLNPVEVPTYDIIRERPDHPYLALLRHQEGLDQIAGSGGDFNIALNLCHWVAAQWSHVNRYEVYPPYQAATILQWLRDDHGHGSRDVTGFCVNFATVLTQCCLAMGLCARSVIVGQPPGKPLGGHFVTEAFCRDLDKWVIFDPDTDVLMTHEGIPVNALDLHRLWLSGKTTEVSYHRGPAYGNSHNSGPVDGETFIRNHLDEGGYRFFGIPMRQDPLSRPDLQLVEHGVTPYRETDVIWWTDDPDLERRFPICTTRPADLHYPRPPAFDSRAIRPYSHNQQPTGS